MQPMNVREPIAVVGMGCRLPGGVSSPDEYWRLLCDGVDATCEVPNGRWPELEALYDPTPGTVGKIYATRGGFLVTDVDAFDARFFGISPREAMAMDPQQRFLLEVAWEALDDAGLSPRSLAGGRTGVFVGICASDYAEAKDPADVYSGTGNYFSVAAGRIAYVFDFRGPAIAVDTACSSSLVAVHLACQSLRLGECNVALAAGVNLILSPSNTVYFCALKTMAPDGRCKTFDAAADGYARGEGCVVLVLKRLSDATATGDVVLGLIRGSAVNQDGRSNGLTAPNGLAQRDVIRDALANAGLEPADVAAVEAHGTGTPLGDPIEMEALAAALGEARRAPLVVGSVKTNFGHLEGAAGLAGLLKMLLAVRHGQIPGHLHFREPNPEIAWDELAVVVPTETMPWPRGRRIGGVSSFGLSGTNAHVIVEAPPDAARNDDEAVDGGGLLLVSAATSDALAVRASAFRHAVAEAGDGRDLADLCYTAGARRAHLAHRLAVAGVDGASMLEGLDAFLAGQPLATVASGHHEAGGSRQVVFVFPGQGGQWPGMGLELLVEPAFRDVFLRCDEFVRREAGWSLLEELSRDKTATRIDATEVTQPATFALQAGVVALLASWGVMPDAIVGHSFGEIAAAHAAGAIGLEDGLRIALQRGRVMKASFGSGRMALVELSVAEVERTVPQLGTSVWISGINGPKSVVLAGDGVTIVDVVRGLEERGIFARVLWGEYPSHSPRMLPFGRDLVQSLAGLGVRAPTVFLVSTVTGRAYAPGDFEPAYWGRNLCEPVQFEVAMRHLGATGADVFLEIGPHPQLTKSMRDCLPSQAVVIGSLRRDSGGRQALRSAVGALYAAGCDLRWEQLFPKGRNVPLPRYPWQRERYWQRSRRPMHREPMAHPLLGRVESTDGSSFRWRNTLTADGLLGDHLIHGEPVMAGAAYVEMALSIAGVLFGGSRAVLDDVYFERVFVPPRTLEALARWEPSGDVSLQFCSGAPEALSQEPLRHATAILRGMGPHEEELRRELPDTIRARCTTHVGAGEWHAFVARVGMRFARGFLCLRELWRGESEVLARIALPEEAHDEASGFRVHPALIDAAVQTLAYGLLRERSALAVPVSIGAVRFFRNPGFATWAHATLRSTTDGLVGGDCVLLDAHGGVALELRDVRLRDLEQSDGIHADSFYQVTWAAASPPRSAPSPARGKWLILADERGVGKTLRLALLAKGESCAMALAGDSYRELEADAFQVDPRRRDDFERLLSRTFQNEPCRGIVHLWGLDAAEPEKLTMRTLQEAADRGCMAVVHLVQAMHATRRACRFWLVTSGATAQASTGIAQSPLWGLAKVLRLEHPDLACTCIDLEPPRPGDQVEALTDELLSAESETEVALRGPARCVARLARAKYTRVEGPRTLRSDATYLLTGGTGGLGLTVARWMIEHGARHIALLARTASPADPALLDELHRRANVHLVRADVADPDQMTAAFRELHTRMPPVRGVIHAAGLLHDARIEHLDGNAFLQPMAAKVAGAWNLHQRTRHLELDFFVLFSSGASLFGTIGQANYAAANAFLDALAEHRHGIGLPALSIQWGAWSEVGIVAERAAAGRLASTSGRSLTVKQGLAALDVLLDSPSPCAGVFPFDVGEWASSHSLLARSPFLSGLVARPARSGLSEKLLQEPCAGRDLVRAALVESVARVLKTPPHRLSVDVSLHQFGLDSLTATELKNAIEAELGIPLGVVMFLRGASIDDLAQELFHRFILEHIDDLSDADVQALTKELE